MAASIKPLGDRVVAEQLEAEQKTASGLYLPTNAQEKPKIAKVVAVGPKVKDVKVGANIIYKEFATTEVKHQNTEYIILKEEDILATV